jgi:hypothetical protein
LALLQELESGRLKQQMCPTFEVSRVYDFLVQRIRRLGDMNAERVVMEEALAAPKCKRCGHPPCPHCMDWCDVVLHEDGDVDLCCDGECDWDWPKAKVEAWCAKQRGDPGPFDPPPEVVRENEKMMKVIAASIKSKRS